MKQKGINRREFLVVTAGASLLLGCGDEQGTDGRPRGGRGDGDGTDLTPTCGELTESNIEGPFFDPGSPERTSLLEPGMQGVRLHLSGRVLSPSCEPLAGALLDFWQADDDGAYDNQGFNLRGHQRADAEGRYELITIVPGHYLNGQQYRPAHIHVKVAATGYKSLTTQLYFEGDPYNGIDPFIRQSLIMPVTDHATSERAARFDFVLAPL